MQHFAGFVIFHAVTLSSVFCKIFNKIFNFDFRHLDISQINKRQGTYENANLCLRSLVQSLCELTSLDISGTNLAGTGSYDREDPEFEELHPVDKNLVRCDIPGLATRVDRPLDFLGLYKTEHDASLRAHIPAKEISGKFTGIPGIYKSGEPNREFLRRTKPNRSFYFLKSMM